MKTVDFYAPNKRVHYLAMIVISLAMAKEKLTVLNDAPGDALEIYQIAVEANCKDPTKVTGAESREVHKAILRRCVAMVS